MGGLFEVEEKTKEIIELEKVTSSPDFWLNQSTAKETLSKLSYIKDDVSTYNNLLTRIDNAIELVDLVDDGELNAIKKDFETLKINTLFDGDYDKDNAYLEIHSGAGGTESNDWASMIFRMYMRFFEKNNYKCEILNEQEGEEVGLKGALLKVSGKKAYGYLKGETGVHRLVRISPFDSNKRRHTSFASVLVTPEIDTNVDIEIKEEDLKIDVFHSSGAGGQSVNTTDSAVRITHLPTKVVVTCQNERSQLQNKEKAMEILKNKLYLIEKSKIDEKLSEIKGSVISVNFGSQIRSYVMCPYTLVKDLRTEYSQTNVDDVLDGDIKGFLEAYLSQKK